MGAKKQYQSPEIYERKLAAIMQRFGVKDGQYNWDYNRAGGWVEFYYKGELYRFDHTVESANRAGAALCYGSDAFAQIVLALEDLARIVSRGIYDLQNWVAGMKALPEQATVPGFCGVLGLSHLPTSEDEIHKAFRRMSKLVAPDLGGSKDEFIILNDAKETALAAVRAGDGHGL